jgi:hypothetical protein
MCYLADDGISHLKYWPNGINWVVRAGNGSEFD